MNLETSFDAENTEKCTGNTKPAKKSLRKGTSCGA